MNVTYTLPPLGQYCMLRTKSIAMMPHVPNLVLYWI